MNKAVFLDRDGTLIIDKIYLNDPKQIVYLEGVFEALRLLRDCGYMFFVVTNQSGVPRGSVQIENLYKIHSIIKDDFARHGVVISNFYYAPFMTNSDHPARKPKPGMLHYANYDYKVDFAKSWMIGDRMIDVEAGHRAGCKSILLKGTEDPKDFSFLPPEYIAQNLLDAAQFIKTASQN